MIDFPNWTRKLMTPAKGDPFPVYERTNERGSVVVDAKLVELAISPATLLAEQWRYYMGPHPRR